MLLFLDRLPYVIQRPFAYSISWKRLSLFYAPTTIYSDNLAVFLRRLGFAHRVLTLSPLSLRVAKAGRNYLNEEITPLLPTGVGE
jgi:hypothetical protein